MGTWTGGVGRFTLAFMSKSVFHIMGVLFWENNFFFLHTILMFEPKLTIYFIIIVLVAVMGLSPLAMNKTWIFLKQKLQIHWRPSSLAKERAGKRQQVNSIHDLNQNDCAAVIGVNAQKKKWSVKFPLTIANTLECFRPCCQQHPQLQIQWKTSLYPQIQFSDTFSLPWMHHWPTSLRLTTLNKNQRYPVGRCL